MLGRLAAHPELIGAIQKQMKPPPMPVLYTIMMIRLDMFKVFHVGYEYDFFSLCENDLRVLRQTALSVTWVDVIRGGRARIVPECSVTIRSGS